MLQAMRIYFAKRAIPAQNLFWMMQQLAVLLAANIPLMNALQALRTLQVHPALGQLIQKLEQSVSNGNAFSQALKQYPQYFSVFTCQLIQAGEQTAALPLALKQWIIYQTQLKQLAQRLRKALFYPALVVSLSLLITIGLLLFIVPQFEQLFASFNAPLPPLTRVVLALTRLLQHQGGYLLAAVFIILLGIKLALGYFPWFAKLLSTWQLRLPMVGRWQRYAITARIVRTLALTTTHHIPLMQGLILSSGVAEHWQYRQALYYTQTVVAQGDMLSLALQKTGCFDGFLIQLVSTGETSGALASLLQQAADWYDNQLAEAIGQLSQWLEPVIMAILGIIIGGLVIAMYLPIFQLGKII